jgi:hypothetical protein
MGEPLTLAPGNIGEDPQLEPAELFFRNPASVSETLLALRFRELNRIALVSPEILRPDEEALSTLPVHPLKAVGLRVEALTGLEDMKLEFRADLSLDCSSFYEGSGSDLELWSLGEEELWQRRPFSFDPASGCMLLEDVSSSLLLAVARMEPPALSIAVSGGKILLSFTPQPGWVYALERSSDLTQETGWETVTNFTPENSDPVTWEEEISPEGKTFFYRLKLSRE